MFGLVASLGRTVSLNHSWGGVSSGQEKDWDKG